MNASVRMPRDLSTSPAIHFSLARTSQNISVRGNRSLAAANTSSNDEAVPCLLSKSTACSHRLRLVGNVAKLCANIARAVATALRDKAALASSAHVRCRSSSSTPRPAVHLTIAALVNGAPANSAASASFSHCERDTMASCLSRLRTALSTMRSTMSPWSCASSNFAAAIHTARSVGRCFLASFRTFRALSYVSRRARASHISTE